MEKEYSKLQKKYNLPNLKELDKDFQISTIEAKKFLLKEIVKKMNEKIEYFSIMLEEVLNPESRLGSLHESSVFNDEEKKDVMKVYKNLHLYYRKTSYLEVSYDEKETADYIKEFFKEWQDMKPGLKAMLNRIKDSWKTDKKSKLELGYFG